MPEILAAPFIIAAIVAFIAGMVRGFAGFGAAMLMTPAFSALYGPAVGIALCLLLEIVVALPLLLPVVRLVDWRRIGLLLLAAVAAIPIGNLALTWDATNGTTGNPAADAFLARPYRAGWSL